MSSPAAIEANGLQAEAPEPAASATRPELSPRGRLIVAVAAPIIAALVLAHYGVGAHGVLLAFFAAVLTWLAMIDFETRLLPNRIVLPAITVLLVGQIARSPGDTGQWLLAGAGAGLFFLIPTLVRRGAVGMGDVKLAVLIGVALGSKVIPALTIGCLAVFPFALWILVRQGRAAARSTALPFGPFLVAGALIALFL